MSTATYFRKLGFKDLSDTDLDEIEDAISTFPELDSLDRSYTRSSGVKLKLNKPINATRKAEIERDMSDALDTLRAQQHTQQQFVQQAQQRARHAGQQAASAAQQQMQHTQPTANNSRELQELNRNVRFFINAFNDSLQTGEKARLNALLRQMSASERQRIVTQYPGLVSHLSPSSLHQTLIEDTSEKSKSTALRRPQPNPTRSAIRFV